jgi:hypothetical protein
MNEEIRQQDHQETRPLRVYPILGEVPKVEAHKGHGERIDDVIEGAEHALGPCVGDLLSIDECEVTPYVGNEAMTKDESVREPQVSPPDCEHEDLKYETG